MKLGWLAALVAAGCVGRAGAGAGDVGVVDESLAVCAAGPVVKGIDISHYDGAIDWAKVKASGIDFAFMKATETTTFVDPTFADNWKAAGAAGMIRGAYHFLRPEVDATAQADFFVATAGVPAAGDLPLALDLEVTDMLSGAAVAASAKTFLARVQEKTGRVPVVYTSASFWTTIGSPAATTFDGYALWDAHWTTNCPNVPTAWMGWTFWQNSSTGTVPGISAASVDLDQFNGSLAELQDYVGASVDGGTDDGGASGDDAGVMANAHHGCSMSGSATASDAWFLCVWMMAALLGLQLRRARRA